AQSDLDHVGQSGALEIFSCNVGVLWIDLECDDLSTGGHSARHPYGAVATECSYFKNFFCSAKLRQYLEKFSLVLRYTDLRNAGFNDSTFSGVNRIVVGNEQPVDIIIYGAE